MLQKNKADGPVEPPQPAKRKPPPSIDEASTAATPTTMATASDDGELILKQITEQGNKVRALKSSKADKVSQ